MAHGGFLLRLFGLAGRSLHFQSGSKQDSGWLGLTLVLEQSHVWAVGVVCKLVLVPRPFGARSLQFSCSCCSSIAIINSNARSRRWHQYPRASFCLAGCSTLSGLWRCMSLGVGSAPAELATGSRPTCTEAKYLCDLVGILPDGRCGVAS